MGSPIAPPGRNGARVASAIGSVWGLATYGILWEGTPVETSRAFVDSALGTLALLPSRVVIWGILGAESVLGKTFDLSTNYAWIAPAAAAVGATLAWTAARLISLTARVRTDLG